MDRGSNLRIKTGEQSFPEWMRRALRIRSAGKPARVPVVGRAESVSVLPGRLRPLPAAAG